MICPDSCQPPDIFRDMRIEEFHENPVERIPEERELLIRN
jgi:hypothetical protein